MNIVVVNCISQQVQYTYIQMTNVLIVCPYLSDIFIYKLLIFQTLFINIPLFINIMDISERIQIEAVCNRPYINSN